MPGFELHSPSFAEGGAIPNRHSCDGQDISPALFWEGAPAGSVAFALIVDDPDARGFIHWVVFNIAGGVTGGLPEGATTGAPQEGLNNFGRIGYGGPCPPGGTHHYRFTLYALSAPLVIKGVPSASDLRQALEPFLLGQATLTGTFARRR
jgi:hypothetical protein